MATKPPNSGPSHGRFRNTNRNMFSKYPSAQPFPLSPSNTVSLGLERQALIYGNRVQRASLKAQAAMVRAQHRMTRRGAIEEGRAMLSDVQGTMADRGIIGSTVNQVAQQDVRAATQGAISDSRFQRDTGLMGVNLSRLEADTQLRLGLLGIAMRRRAAQREATLGAYGSGGQNPWGY